MTVKGYIRVSTLEQNEARQIKEMKKLGVSKENMFIDKQSGKDFQRERYQLMRDGIREGDLIYIDDLDRLGRNYDEILKEWKHITRELKADIVIIANMELFDSRKFRAMGDIGKLLEDQFLSMLAYTAEQERKKILRRQKQGIAIAKENGKYKGRKTHLVEGGKEEARMKAIVEAYKAGKSIKDIRVTFKVGTGTIYRLLEREGLK